MTTTATTTLPGQSWLGGLLAAACLSAATGAWATPSIQTRAIALRIIPAPTTTPTIDRNCLACHTGGATGANVSDLRPGFRAAYLQDMTRLSRLRALLNVLPTTTVGTVNSGVARTDVYEVICTADAVSLGVWVRDLAPVMLPTISAQVTLGTQVSRTVTDPIDGDDRSSAQARLSGPANAVYLVRVSKSAYTGDLAANRGPETYSGRLACRNAAGARTGLAWRLIQNQ